MNTQQGLSLIELMVVVAITAVLAGVAIPSYSTALISSKVTVMANLVSQDLNFAKYHALRQNGKPVYLTINNGALCLSSSASPNTCDIRKDLISSSVALTMVDAKNTGTAVSQITFGSIYGLPNQAVQFNISATNGSYTKTKTITLNTIGLIKTVSS